MRPPLEVLGEFWGYTSFREPQAAVISNALSGHDSLVVMATGGGKSICYQVPPLVSGRMCIVVSPLIALMEDQVAALTARGVKAAMLGSAQTSAEVKRRAWAGEFDLVYITPELATHNTAALQQLHRTRCIGLVAIDEAHCCSEWGHDFRPAYRELGVLREALPGVPIMAVTATATQRVQQDIIKLLHMNQPGSPPFKQWVMSFQRPNLRLSVQLKASGGAPANLAGLVAEAQQGNSPGPTLVYAQTTNEVDTLTAHLQAKGVKAVKYHAKLPLSERVASHKAFQRDDASVMVASLAFGMGIDKPNIRRIIHYGIPSSLESYYQQAGRAGRDGLQAECCLLWSPQDFVMQDMIKGAGNLTGWTLDSHTRGMEALRCYTSTGDCRHAALVNFFQPGTLDANGPCQGGCDNCTRRQAAAPGTQAGTDITQPALLLVAAVKGLKCFGLNRAVLVLKGSKGKQVDPWMQELTAPDGSKLHGAGSNRSEEWWKGLGNVLMAQGLLASKSKSGATGMTFSVTVVTPKGLQWLSSPQPAPLRVMLPSHMQEELSRQQRREAAEAQRAAERQMAQQKRDEEAGERQQLLAALRAARKAKADELGQAPDVLVNDATLQLLVELRPATQQDLSSVSGFGAAALQHFGQPLLQVVQDFCRHSQHLKHNTNWVVVKRMRTEAQAGQQQQFQQHLQQFRMLTPSGTGTGPSGVAPPAAQGQSSLQPGPWYAQGSSSASAAAAAAAAAGASSDAAALHQEQQQQQEAAPAGPLLTACQDVYQALLDSKVLSEPKKAASSAWDQWELGQTVTQIATEGREKPVQESTVLGYLAEAAASYGCSLQQAHKLQAAAGLAGDAGGEALLWRVVAVLNSNKGCSLSFLKSNVPPEASYGQLKVAAALLALQAVPGTDPAAAQQEEQQQLAALQDAPQLSPELQRLLQPPGSNAQELYRMWQQGVPLEVLGNMHSGGNMPIQTVLGYLADAAAAGFAVDAQALAAAALLQHNTAQAIAAAIKLHGMQGVHSVRQALQQQLGDVTPGQVKVVAALMATKAAFFCEADPTTTAAAGQAEGAAGGSAGAAATATAGAAAASAVDCKPMSNAGAAPMDAAAVHDPAAAGPAAVSQGPPSAAAAAEEEAGPGLAAAAVAGAEGPPDTDAAAAARSSSEAATTAAAVEPAASAPAVAPVAAPRRKLPTGLLISNRTGKRRRPTAIAGPAATEAPETAQPAASVDAAAAAVAAAAVDGHGRGRDTAAGGVPGGAAAVRDTSRRLSGAAKQSPLQLSRVLPPSPAGWQLQRPGSAGHAAATPAPAAARVQALTPAAPAANTPAGANTPATSGAARAQVPWVQAVTPAAAATPAPQTAVAITQDSVLQLLWKATCTAPELLHKLGARTPQHAQQLKQVLENLVAAGDQVCTTPECTCIDVRDTSVRFIAF